MPFTLPDGLPSGRFLSHGPVRVWASDEFPHAVERLWPRLPSECATHGLFPLLCAPEAVAGTLAPKRVDAVRLEAVLAEDFADHRRQRLPPHARPRPPRQ